LRWHSSHNLKGQNMDRTAPAGAAISLALISTVVGGMSKVQAANAKSTVVAIERYGAKIGLHQM
jgi:hypothetical protein